MKLCVFIYSTRMMLVVWLYVNKNRFCINDEMKAAQALIFFSRMLFSEIFSKWIPWIILSTYWVMGGIFVMNSIKTPKLCKNQQFLLKDRWENNHKCNHLAKNWTSIFLTNLLKIHYKLNFMPKFLHIYMHWIITLTLLIIYKWKIYDKPIRNYFFMNSSATIFFSTTLICS